MQDAKSQQPTTTPVAALVDNHRRFLAFLEKRVGDRHSAEEILQEAFVRGIERAGDLRDEEKVVAWFYRLLRNAVADHWRQRAADERGMALLARELGDGHDPAPEIEAEICRCFEPLLPTLKAEHAELLERVDLGGERPVDVARDRGENANATMVRLHRARRALRDRLVVSCRTCAEHGCLDCSCGPSAAP